MRQAGGWLCCWRLCLRTPACPAAWQGGWGGPKGRLLPQVSLPLLPLPLLLLLLPTIRVGELLRRLLQLLLLLPFAPTLLAR
jgi:hypothetical protein